MKILLVEDSPTLRHAMSAYIVKAGHEVVLAETGEEAVQIVENTPIEMILMDVEMPGLNGFETTKLIREMLGDHWVPIIFVTGQSEDKSLEEAIEAGGDDYLVKPVSQVILSAKIRAMERITNMRDELAALNRELKKLSQYDGLTQLLNRRTFTEKANEHWRQATRTKQPFTIILLDIDHFKLYNDRYGHPEGDECIRRVSAVLKDCLNRPGDIVARYGGEEFIAFLPNTPESGALHICERIRASVEALQLKHQSSSISQYVTVSIGANVVKFTTGTDLDKQIALADKALYNSKNEGRNRSTVEEFSTENKVLIVDNCTDTQSIIEKNLNGHCKVHSICLAEEAVMTAMQFKPDLILIEVELDSIDGYQVCAELRENRHTASVPIILISSDNIDEVKRRGKEVQANACLQKPFNTDRLVAKINQFLI